MSFADAADAARAPGARMRAALIVSSCSQHFRGLGLRVCKGLGFKVWDFGKVFGVESFSIWVYDPGSGHLELRG